ncbi:hypothetical protein [Candidatus Finniella inopinata]|uniref:Uncharacterized protein n=1 Tax=Candidatus Finniella inopinata TaxID=1696036 RepID=A0A4Q7DL63_9PROT|nr:hypothetical protein [Candidatus Finniella inopinata]RZI46894.1 hypothetical protein EQU50_01330 [Candidatus Finniella inopinata]
MQGSEGGDSDQPPITSWRATAAVSLAQQHYVWQLWKCPHRAKPKYPRTAEERGDNWVAQGHFTIGETALLNLTVEKFRHTHS